MAASLSLPELVTLLPISQPSTPTPGLVEATPEKRPLRGAEELAASNSLLDLDQELDSMLDIMQDELEEEGAISEESKAAFEMFCAAFGQKVDRIARYLSVMEARTAYCKKEAGRLQLRARVAESKERQTKNLLLYYLQTRELKKIEGPQFTISCRKNSQDSLKLDKEMPPLPSHLEAVTLTLSGDSFEALLDQSTADSREKLTAAVQSRIPSNEAIRREILAGGIVPGARLSREHHIRVT